ncbi:MAG: zincin-like metallopeptidase domain-containing protein [Candidatus Acidiferrales bacterium]
MTDTTARKDVYSRITAQIVGHLEKGVRPWVRPWNAEHAAGHIARPLRHNGQPYSGINILSLWMSALSQTFVAPIWMTYRQAAEFGAPVRKGEKGSLVVYANAVTRTEHDDKTGEDIEREIPYMKGYTVFNVEQIEGLPEIFYAKIVLSRDPIARIAHAESFFASLGATMKHGGNRAYYAQELDYVQMPPFEAFKDAESYYATLAHECTHWTKHPQRLDRDFGCKTWDDEGYSREELVAELGSAFLWADLELHQEPREENAAYIASWLEVLKSDTHAIFAAAAHAQRAADYLHRKAAPAAGFSFVSAPIFAISPSANFLRYSCCLRSTCVRHGGKRSSEIHKKSSTTSSGPSP